MKDHVKEALNATAIKVVGVPSTTTCEMPDLSGVLVPEPLRADDAARFLRSLIAKGPDSHMINTDFPSIGVEWARTGDGWAVHQFLTHLADRLEAIAEGKKL